MKDFKQLPANFKEIIIQSLASIRKKFNTPGPGIADIQVIIDGFKDDFDALIKKCG